MDETEQGAQFQELDNEKSRTSELGRTGTNASTKSLAEQMSLMEEILFVSVICLAQLCTQVSQRSFTAIFQDGNTDKGHNIGRTRTGACNSKWNSR